MRKIEWRKYLPVPQKPEKKPGVQRVERLWTKKERVFSRSFSSAFFFSV